MTKTRILFISRSYGEVGGGMERLSFDFINESKKHPEIEATSIVNVIRPNRSLLQVRTQSVFFGLRIIPQALLAASKVDVVHIGDPVLSFIGWLIQKIFRKPVVVTVHGLDITYKNNLYQMYLRVFFSNFSLYLPISTHVKDLLRARGIQGPIQTLTPGVYDRHFNNSLTRSALAALLDINEEELATTTVVLTSGRLVSRKGHAWFISNVLPSLPDRTVYVIAGDGPASIEISDAIETSRQSDRVRLLGRISEDDLKTLYNTADIFVQPNLPVPGDIEGFGLVLVEAALCNLRVVASDLEGIKDAIHNGKNGTLVAAGDSKAWVQAVTNAIHSEKTTVPRAYTLTEFSWPNRIAKYHSTIKQFVLSHEAADR